MLYFFKLFILINFSVSALYAEQPELNILTYASFAGKGSAGAELKTLFEKSCGCVLKFQLVDNGLALVADLKIAKGNVSSDVILGVDGSSLQVISSFVQEISVTDKVFFNSTLSEKTWENFVPIDFSFLTFIVDTRKVKKIPKSWREILDSWDFNEKIILQDPRSSTPGFGLLLSLQAIFNDNLEAQLKKLKKLTLTVGKGWSETYGLFTKGESWFVWSYTSSESYHRSHGDETNYKALYLDEGHLMQTEYVGILKRAKNKNLALDFVKFLTTPSAQKIIAEKNWMLPVNLQARPLITKKALLDQKEPARIFKVEPQQISSAGKKELVDKWLKTF